MATLAAGGPKRRVPFIWPTLVFIISVGLCLPFTRTVLWFADEGIWLSGALRLIHGRGLYTETFAIHPPGGYLITAGWLSLFGTSIVSARLLATASVAGIGCCSYLACDKVARHRPLAVAVALAWVLMTQGLATAVNHHYFTTFFSMLAAWFALLAADATRPKDVLGYAAFLCAGIATMITPTQGVLLTIALAAGMPGTWHSGAKVRLLAARLACFAVAPLAVLAYLVMHHALSAAYADTVIFPLSRFSAIQWRPFGAGTSLQNLPLALLLPACVAFVPVALVLRGRAVLADAQWRLCAGFAVAGCLGAWPRPDFAHIGFTAPMALPLLCRGVAALDGARARLWRSAALLATAAFTVPACAAYVTLLVETSEWVRAPTAQGAIRLPAGYSNRAVLIATLMAAPTTDKVFFYPYLMMMPYLTGRDQVSRNDIFLPGYTTPAQYRESCAAVMRSADWIVIEKRWTEPRFLKTIFPAMKDMNPPEKAALEAAIATNFSLVSDDAEFTVRRRTTGSSPRPSDDQAHDLGAAGALAAP